jgi:hypothetical protein
VSRNRGRRRSSGAQRRPDYDRIAQLEAELAQARAAEDADLDEQIADAEAERVAQVPRGRSDQDKPKVVHFKGKRFKLPGDPGDWDLESLEAFEAGQAATACKGILGQASWAEIKRLGAKTRDLEGIVQQIAKAYGFSAVGESQASDD